VKKHYFSAYSGLPREVYFLFAARLVNCLGYFVTPLLTLILTQKLGLGKAETGTAVALLILTQAPCVILGGRLADTIGRKKTFLIGSLAGAAVYLVCGLGISGRAMIFCIIAAADFVAVSAPAADALLADLTKPEDRQAAFSLLYLGINIGMAVSPLIGGLLFRNHLPLLFILDAVSSFASAAITARYVPEVFSRKKKTNGEISSVSLYGVLKRAPVLVFFVLLLFLYDFCYTQWDFMLPAQFGDMFADDGARRYSILCSVNAVTVIVMTPLITNLTRRLHPLKAVALAGIFYIAAYAGFCGGGNYYFYILFGVLFTLGEICTAIQVGTFLSNRTPADCLGRVNAFSTFMRGAAKSLGPLLMGQLLAVWDYSDGWRTAACITIAAAAGFFLLDRWDTETER